MQTAPFPSMKCLRSEREEICRGGFLVPLNRGGIRKKTQLKLGWVQKDISSYVDLIAIKIFLKRWPYRWLVYVSLDISSSSVPTQNNRPQSSPLMCKASFIFVVRYAASSSGPGVIHALTKMIELMFIVRVIFMFYSWRYAFFYHTKDAAFLFLRTVTDFTSTVTDSPLHVTDSTFCCNGLYIT